MQVWSVDTIMLVVVTEIIVRINYLDRKTDNKRHHQRPTRKLNAGLNYCLNLSLFHVQGSYALLQPFLQKQARKLHAVMGDGNCLFRALSHQLTGDEQSHITLRKIIVDFEALNPQVFARLVVAINEREFLNT